MANCKRCNLPVRWVMTDGKWRCLNPDGKEHWDTCSEVRWQRVVKEGVRFEETRSTGYHHEGKRKYESMAAPTVKATDFSLPACNCASPPWEDCEHTIKTERKQWQQMIRATD